MVAAGPTQTPRAHIRKRDGKQSNIKKLDHKLVSEALNEMFSMNTRHNECMLNVFILENDNTFTDSESEDNSAAAFCSNVRHVNICLVF